MSDKPRAGLWAGWKVARKAGSLVANWAAQRVDKKAAKKAASLAAR